MRAKVIDPQMRFETDVVIQKADQANIAGNPTRVATARIRLVRRDMRSSRSWLAEIGLVTIAPRLRVYGRHAIYDIYNTVSTMYLRLPTLPLVGTGPGA